MNLKAQNNYELLFKSLSQCTDDIIFVVDFEIQTLTLVIEADYIVLL